MEQGVEDPVVHEVVLHELLGGLATEGSLVVLSGDGRAALAVLPEDVAIEAHALGVGLRRDRDRNQTKQQETEALELTHHGFEYLREGTERG